jgi:hypothetical protein
MTFKALFVITVLSVAVFLSACGKSNNLLLGRVQAKLGTHVVVVTDCYRTSVSPAQASTNSADGSTVYRFKPCADADIVIHNEQLTVNGKRFESLVPGETVIVDHGQVLVNTHIARNAPENP